MSSPTRTCIFDRGTHESDTVFAGTIVVLHGVYRLLAHFFTALKTSTKRHLEITDDSSYIQINELCNVI